MVLRFWWLALSLLAVAVVLAVIRYFLVRSRTRSSEGELLIAHSQRVRLLPRFKALVKREVFWQGLGVLATALAMLGALLLVARPVDVAMDSTEMKSRDVVLCLDVSGSMSEADMVVIESYLRIVDQLQGERIALVVWSSSAATAFPLTDDYVFVREQLEAMKVALGSQDQEVDSLDALAVLAAARMGDGASLIGDGLMSCNLAFDRQAETRPRTVILATDNELAATPIFTLKEAAEKSKEQGILVMGIIPDGEDSHYKDELREATAVTGGTVIDLVDDPAITQRIVDGVQAQQRKAIMGAPRSRSFDLVWPGAALFSVGLAGMILSAARRRS